MPDPCCRSPLTRWALTLAGVAAVALFAYIVLHGSPS
jgi:hypothetical protein